MPNIVIVGFKPGELPIVRGRISIIVTGLGIAGADGVITCFQNASAVDITKEHNDAPYVIVRDTEENRAMLIAREINLKLNVDVELEVLHAFLPKRH